MSRGAKQRKEWKDLDLPQILTIAVSGKTAGAEAKKALTVFEQMGGRLLNGEERAQASNNSVYYPLSNCSGCPNDLTSRFTDLAWKKSIQLKGFGFSTGVEAIQAWLPELYENNAAIVGYNLAAMREDKKYHNVARKVSVEEAIKKKSLSTSARH